MRSHTSTQGANRHSTLTCEFLVKRTTNKTGKGSPSLPSLSSIFVLFFNEYVFLKNYIIILKYQKSKYANEKVGE